MIQIGAGVDVAIAATLPECCTERISCGVVQLRHEGQIAGCKVAAVGGRFVIALRLGRCGRDG